MRRGVEVNEPTLWAFRKGAPGRVNNPRSFLIDGDMLSVLKTARKLAC